MASNVEDRPSSNVSLDPDTDVTKSRYGEGFSNVGLSLASIRGNDKEDESQSNVGSRTRQKTEKGKLYEL